MDPNIAVIPKRVYNMATLVTQIREYIQDPRIQHSMVLPPMEKYERARVHELATAFNLKSQSKGGGNSRYTTLSKTRFTGTKINEGKVKRLIGGGDMSFGGVPVRGGKGNSTPVMPKQRDGEIVGKVCSLACSICTVILI